MRQQLSTETEKIMTLKPSCSWRFFVVVVTVVYALVAMLGFLVIRYRKNVDCQLACPWQCDLFNRDALFYSDCHYAEPIPDEAPGADQSRWSTIRGRILARSPTMHEVLHLAAEAKKDIMRLKFGDAEAGISAALNNLLDMIESIDLVQASELRADMLAPVAAANPCKEGCVRVKPINLAVSIVLNAMTPATSRNLEEILRGIQHFYPGMSVYVAADGSVTVDKALHSSVQFIAGDKRRPAVNWSNLLRKVSTPYVLLGRGLTRFGGDVDLERALGLAAEFDAVGGSVRDAEGRWSLGCQQLTYMNYTLKYKNGYFQERNSCLRCEHLLSPFLARTQLVKTVGLSDALSEGMLFEDFFIRMKRQRKSVVNCPEVMFHTVPRADSREDWLSLVKERKVNRVYLADGRAYRYSCADAGVKCSLSAGLVSAPCCLEALQYSVRDLFREWGNRGLDIELNCGQVIGAVKMSAVLPWEKDADLLILTRDLQTMQQLTPRMKSLGYRLVNGSKPKCCWFDTKNLTDGYFALHAGIWRSDVYGRGGLPSQHLRALGLTPTRTLVDGEWLQGPPNPTLFVRNLYAHEIFRHHEHSLDTGLGGGFVEYRPSKLNMCPVRGHQACLDQFHVDGNIQFKQELH